MKKYRTFLKIEVEAENEVDAVTKMQEQMSSGELTITDLEVVE